MLTDHEPKRRFGEYPEPLRNLAARNAVVRTHLFALECGDHPSLVSALVGIVRDLAEQNERLTAAESMRLMADPRRRVVMAPLGIEPLRSLTPEQRAARSEMVRDVLAPSLGPLPKVTLNTPAGPVVMPPEWVAGVLADAATAVSGEEADAPHVATG